MSQYKRMISYMYQYVAGEKGQNIGFVRIEQRGSSLRLILQMRTIELSVMPEVWLFRQQSTGIEYIKAGKIGYHSGNLYLRIDTECDNVCDSGKSFDDIDGVILFISSREYYATSWTNDSIYLGEMTEYVNKVNKHEDKDGYKENNIAKKQDEILDKSGDVSEVKGSDIVEKESKDDLDKNKQEERLKITNIMKDNKNVTGQEKNILTKQDIISEKETTKTDMVDDKSEYFPKENLKIPENDKSGYIPKEYPAKENFKRMVNDKDLRIAEIKEKEPELQKSDKCSMCDNCPYNDKNNDFGERILSTFPVMYPFVSGKIVKSVRIEPKDIGCLPVNKWAISNNRFLLHGYYCYRHLIFVKLKDGRYAIGVPGVFSDKADKTAREYSFDEFQAIGTEKRCHGAFGYWLSIVL